MDDRRIYPRQQTELSAKLVFDCPINPTYTNPAQRLRANPAIVDCIIRDLSDGGACLELSSTAEIPPSFNLLFDGDISRPCRLAWKSRTRIGMSFQ